MEAYLLSLGWMVEFFAITVLGVFSLLSLICGIVLPCMRNGWERLWAFPFLIAGILGLALFKMLLT